MSEKKKILLAVIVFIVTFLVFRTIFSNLDAIKSFFIGN